MEEQPGTSTCSQVSAAFLCYKLTFRIPASLPAHHLPRCNCCPDTSLEFSSSHIHAPELHKHPEVALVNQASLEPNIPKYTLIVIPAIERVDSPLSPRSPEVQQETAPPSLNPRLSRVQRFKDYLRVEQRSMLMRMSTDPGPSSSGWTSSSSS